MIKRIIIFIIFLLAVSMAESQRSDKIALVIGNSRYKTAPLQNPENDACDISRVLSQIGFKVTTKLNLSRRDMRKAIRNFGQKMSTAKVVLFYYAGHGMQVDGVNYLIPVGANVEAEDEIEDEAIDAGLIFRKMQTFSKALNIIIMDACRDNPFARSFRSAQKGLAQIDAPQGSIIIYATAPGKTAEDGKGRNGTFTEFFLKHIRTPGLELEILLKRVTKDIVRQTNGRQVPWRSSSLMDEFYFVRSKSTKNITVPKFPMVKSNLKKVVKPKKHNTEITATSLKAEVKRTGAMNIFKDLFDSSSEPDKVTEAPSFKADDDFLLIDGFQYLRTCTYECNGNKFTVKEYRHQDTGMVFVLVPGGSFLMGNDRKYSQRPQHRVEIKPFLISKYEVTQKVWKKIMGGSNPSCFQNENNPVERVTWYDCKKFCDLTGLELPSESQWEYACRAGSSTTYYWGEKMDGGYAWYRKNANKTTHNVGSLTPNAFGLFDMTGNVREWCFDAWKRDHRNAPKKGRPRRGGSSSRVYKGGGYDSYYGNCTSGCRDWRTKSYKSEDIGFRVVAKVPDPEEEKLRSARRIYYEQNSVVIQGFKYKYTGVYQCKDQKFHIREYRHQLTGLDFVLIPQGSFLIGNTKKRGEGPQQVINISPFLMSKYEVTQKVWKKIMGKNPSHLQNEYHPVEGVSWNDCQMFCLTTGLELPSESQWEYACRAGSATKYYWGDEIDEDYCWYNYVSEKHSHPVGQLRPNAFGLYDITGNVSEWCQDSWNSNHKEIPADGSPRLGTTIRRVYKGGGYDSHPAVCRSSSRDWLPKTYTRNDIGLRPVYNIKKNNGF